MHRLHRSRSNECQVGATVVAVLCYAFLAGCGAPRAQVTGADFIPSSISSPQHARASIVIFAPRHSRHTVRSVSVELNPIPSGTGVFKTIVNVSPMAAGCNTTSSGTVCTRIFDQMPGRYEAVLAAYSGPNGRASIVSQGQEVPFRIVPGRSNRLALSLDSVPTSYLVAPISPAVSGSASSGFTIGVRGVWGDPQTFLIDARDASGNVIVARWSPKLTSSHKDFALGPPTHAMPSAFSVTPPARSTSASTLLHIQAVFDDSAICRQPRALCNLAVRVNYAPFARDDWIAFAHDFRRSAVQEQPTGISAASVAALKQRWKVSLPHAVYASPLVYKGEVFVATTGLGSAGKYSAALYDLSARDGSIRWKRTLANAFGDHVRGSPTIDTDDALVFIGTTYFAPSGAARPSKLYAIDLTNGRIAWKAVLPGFVRGAAVYDTGVVYQGWSGGDPPACLNGGVRAFNARTGAVEWTWLTNPFTNSGGGGGIWGALAWDGKHLIFGTGNTCQREPWDQGAVALRSDGSMVWSFQADPDVSNDDDTGSGVLIQNGTATLMNKNGSLYTLDASTGKKLVAIALGATVGNGGFATPTSDGSIVVVGAGYFPTSSSTNDSHVVDWRRKKPATEFPGYMSFLKAVSPTGHVLWSIPMANSIDSYAAVNNGVVFAGMDTNLDAIAIQTGRILKEFPVVAGLEAGPVVVPSGLYMADWAGNVYALSLPSDTN